jgi:IS1 family transposase
MNILPRETQIAIISAITEGLGIRAAARLTGSDRGAVASLALRIGHGCAELHDRMMVGIRVGRIELDELWAYVGCKQKRVKPGQTWRGDQYTFIAMAATQKAIIAYRTGKRDGANTDEFIGDLRERVLGAPEFSSDGWSSYITAIGRFFGNRVSYGQCVKTLSVTDLRREAAHRYSPAAVVAVSREVVSGVPAEISTSFVERGNLSIRMASRRFTRLTNGFSKKLQNHAAAVSLYVAHYNLCRVHETLTENAGRQTTPAMALGLTDHIWSIGELLDAALTKSSPDDGRRRPRPQLRVIDGGKI